MRTCSWSLLLLAFLLACAGPEPSGIRATPDGTGPRVRYDPNAKPLADVPLPSDLATRVDSSSPTGRRLNLPLVASTQAEVRVRNKADQMDGFGLYSPIWVSFDAPLDLANIRDRHTKNHEYTDDAVLLINVDPRSPGYGEAIPLEAGQGNFPITLEWPWQYWDNDEHADSNNLLYETHDEDANANGVLDPYEDRDFDGVLDRPNTWDGKDPGPDNADTLITFYEKQTNTLVLWPVVPMRAATTYAVVLTDRLVGEDGKPVRSPFPFVNHVDQTPALEPLLPKLNKYGLAVDNVAYAWTFTTQTITNELEDIRKGLYGTGDLKWLAEKFPPDLAPKVVQDADEEGKLSSTPFILSGELVLPLISVLGPLLTYPPEVVTKLQEDAKYIDYWVLGSFTTPNFLADQDGIATPMYPSDDNESFLIDAKNHKASVVGSKATFICGIPKQTAEHKAPFPVQIYGHGYSGAPFEVFGFAGRMAQFGFAMCGLDAPGHGLALPADDTVDWNGLLVGTDPEDPSSGLLYGLGLRAFYLGFKDGRIRDLDNDGKITSFDNGGDFWSWDVFHLRDMVRQTVVDHIQFIRALRGLGTAKWNADTNTDGQPDLAGDWNGDGVPDLGTPANLDYTMWGQSMGAIVSQVAAAVEPAITASTPISGAGGLIQVGLRSVNPGVPEAVMMPFMGPFVSFTPLKDGSVEVAWIINHLHREFLRTKPGEDPAPGRPHYYPFARTKLINPGDTVVIRNLVNGETVHAFRPKDGSGFRVSLPVDALGAVEKRSVLGLKDGDTLPVPVGCPGNTWRVETDAEGAKHVVCDATDPDRVKLLGDSVSIEIHEGWDDYGKGKAVKGTLNKFEIPVTYEGAIYPVDTPLVALATGYGRARNTPDFRKLMAVAATIVERGDPAAYARHYKASDRLDFSYDTELYPNGTPLHPQANIVMYHSVGDPNVAVAAGVGLARAAGALAYDGPMGNDNDLLLEAHVMEGIERFQRWSSSKLTIRDWAYERNKYLCDVGGAPSDLQCSALCGNKKCDAGEDAQNCPEDCGTCGDGVCGPAEWSLTKNTCDADCPGAIQRNYLVDKRWVDQYADLAAVEWSWTVPNAYIVLPGAYNPPRAANPGMAMPLHADPDNVDRGLDPFGEPDVPGYDPITKGSGTLHNEHGYIALRLPYVYPAGSHGVEPDNPSRAFNMNNYIENQIAVFLQSNGKVLADGQCLADNTCEFLPATVRKK